MNTRLVTVIGTRPNIVKAGPFLTALRRRPGILNTLVHTGQHYDADLSGNLQRELGLDSVDHNLDVGSGTHATQVGTVLQRMEKPLLSARPAAVVVFGDVNSTVAAAMAGAQLGVPVVHAEAGLRSGDDSIEELNRRQITRLAQLHLAPCRWSGLNLVAERIPSATVRTVGSLMACSALLYGRSGGEERLAELDLVPGRYVVVTAHKESAVLDAAGVAALTTVLRKLSARIDVVFPLHPRTKRTLDRHVDPQDLERVRLVPPLGFRDMACLVRHAHAVLTDSDGLQDETTVHNVPCFTFAPATARRATVEVGTNTLVALTEPDLVDRILAARPHGTPPRVPLWDEHVGERMVASMAEVVLHG
ncbi:UDP-N-acetyl glucosamine 2-epimerase [Streptomyces sp. NPDC049099]|uniref:UDP-N-acetyl glucosamine 2-epimerase n=1 Tax=Streptomyces sp. NPDC049099 TaxID=3155768 RepID=UPI00342656FD